MVRSGRVDPQHQAVSGNSARKGPIPYDTSFFSRSWVPRSGTWRCVKCPMEHFLSSGSLRFGYGISSREICCVLCLHLPLDSVGRLASSLGEYIFAPYFGSLMLLEVTKIMSFSNRGMKCNFPTSASSKSLLSSLRRHIPEEDNKDRTIPV